MALTGTKCARIGSVSVIITGFLVGVCLSHGTEFQHGALNCSLQCSINGKEPVKYQYEQGECVPFDRQAPCSMDSGTDELVLDLRPAFTNSREESCYMRPHTRYARWDPALNVSWTLHSTGTAFRNFSLHIASLEPHSTAYVNRNWSRCLTFSLQPNNVNVLTAQVPGGERGRHSMSCSYVCTPTPAHTLYVFVESRSETAAPGGSPCTYSDSAIIHFPMDRKQHYTGLPMYFRRPLVPSSELEKEYVYPNPRYWTTDVVVRNQSRAGKVDVTFDLAPANHDVGRYVIVLVRIADPLEDEGRLVFTPGISQVLGHVTFTNVSDGVYFVTVRSESQKGEGYCWTANPSHDNKLERLPDDPCTSASRSDQKCPIMKTGLFSMQGETHPVKTSLFTEKNPRYLSTGEGTEYTGNFTTSSLQLISSYRTTKIAAIISGVGAAVLLVGVTGIILYRQPRKAPPSGDHDHEQASDEPGDTIAVGNRRIFIVYSMDNNIHTEVVVKFADFLSEVGKHHVIVDERESTDVYKTTSIEWTLSQIDLADKVLIVESEGAYRRYSARLKRMHYPKFESEKPLGKMFTVAMKILLDGSHDDNRGKFFNITFPYSRHRNDFRLAGNDSNFSLMKNIEELMLAVEDKSKHAYGFLHRWLPASETAWENSQVGRSLKISIDKAIAFHKQSQQEYNFGELEPFSDSNTNTKSQQKYGITEPTAESDANIRQFESDCDTDTAETELNVSDEVTVSGRPSHIQTKSELEIFNELLPPSSVGSHSVLSFSSNGSLPPSHVYESMEPDVPANFCTSVYEFESGFGTLYTDGHDVVAASWPGGRLSWYPPGSDTTSLCSDEEIETVGDWADLSHTGTQEYITDTSCV